MSDLSIAVIVGRLTRDAELKYTPSGAAVCHFSVATSSKKKKGDEWVEEASFWDVDLWGKQGESLNQYLVKGKLVAVEGTMRQDRWEQDGQPRMKVSVNANSVQMLGPKTENSQAGEQPDKLSAMEKRVLSPFSNDRPGQDAINAKRKNVQPGLDDFSDDIPF